jgi:plastocyanin
VIGQAGGDSLSLRARGAPGGEHLARLVVAALTVGVLAVFGIDLAMRSARSDAVVELRAAMPEVGGWSDHELQAQVGEPLALRLTSDDVVHGFAVGRHDAAPVDIHPGEWVTTTLVFEEPGVYTYYCARWCGPGHWRMRGTIVVDGESASAPPPAPPRYVAYGIDLDAPAPADVIPDRRPDAVRGAAWADRLPGYMLDADTYWRYSPAELWHRLRDMPDLAGLSDMALWDAVAWVWHYHIGTERLALGRELYALEAAAAHGEAGAGDGVMVGDLPAYDYDIKGSGHGLMAPPNLADPRHTLGASPARLEGKLLRGGMGTGMPSYGAVYTPREIEALVAYLYTFVMSLEGGE